MKKPPPTVAVIAGLDPTGGAGLAADIHAVTDAGAHPLPLMTANTIQGQGIATRFEVVEPVFLSDQLNAVFQNHKPGAIKLGMLGSPEAVQALVSALEKWSVMAPLIMDPVRSASSGGDLVGVGMRKELLNLLQYTVLITPNRDELSWLTGCEVSTESEIEDAVVFLGEHGCGSILIKGGHSKGAPVDTLYTQGIPVWSRTGERYDFTLRGTGCRLASFAAAMLAKGNDLIPAVDAAYNYVQDLFLKHLK